jgi:CheY-like chemotaxis protein
MSEWQARVESSGKKPRLLVVDDSKLDLKMNREAFEKRGYEVVTTCAVDDFMFREELAEIIQREKPDCILTDFAMGFMNGFDTLRAAQEVAPGVPVVLNSSVPSDAAKLAGKPLEELVGPQGFAAIHLKGQANAIDAAFKECLAKGKSPTR